MAINLTLQRVPKQQTESNYGSPFPSRNGHGWPKPEMSLDAAFPARAKSDFPGPGSGSRISAGSGQRSPADRCGWPALGYAAWLSSGIADAATISLMAFKHLSRIFMQALTVDSFASSRYADLFEVVSHVSIFPS